MYAKAAFIVPFIFLAGCPELKSVWVDALDSDSSTSGETEGQSGEDTRFEGDPTDDGDGAAEGSVSDCSPTYDYAALGTVCYVDSLKGDDAQSGVTEAEAVQTQHAIPENCDVIRFKRGSVFEAPLTTHRRASVYTNYGDESEPLPQFTVSRDECTGPVFSGAPLTNVTLDGLYFSGATGSDEGMSNAAVCVLLGQGGRLLNSEITECDTAVSVFGDDAVVWGNDIHDIYDWFGDPRGGGQGVLLRGSNIEVAYNRFERCFRTGDTYNSDYAGCDGAAVEVRVLPGRTISNVRVHHNFAAANCGFLKMKSTVSLTTGFVEGVSVSENLIIDNDWLTFLDLWVTESVVTASVSEIQFYNNTFAQRAASTHRGRLVLGGPMYEIMEDGAYSLVNNLFVHDGFLDGFDTMIPEAFVQQSNLLFGEETSFPVVANLYGDRFEDFELTANSPAVNTGTLIPNNTLDFMNRTVPDPSGRPDIGAFERGGTSSSCLP